MDKRKDSIIFAKRALKDAIDYHTKKKVIFTSYSVIFKARRDMLHRLSSDFVLQSLVRELFIEKVFPANYKEKLISVLTTKGHVWMFLYYPMGADISNYLK